MPQTKKQKKQKKQKNTTKGQLWGENKVNYLSSATFPFHFILFFVHSWHSLSELLEVQSVLRKVPDFKGIGPHKDAIFGLTLKILLALHTVHQKHTKKRDQPR